MALITWDESYSVKVAELDGHHQKLFYLMNCLHDAMSEGKGNRIIRGTVKELVNLTHIHFQREEALMEQANFPGLEDHRIEHQRLMGRVAEFQAALDRGRGLNTAAVLEFLRAWVPKHIQGTDKGYSAHLNAQGIH
jgi:hemerythrin